MRRLAVLVVVGIAVAATSAFAKSPWPGLAASVVDPQHAIRYSAGRANGATTVYASRSGRDVATLKVDGEWGVPAVTTAGAPGGLSSDGRTLVLVEPWRLTDSRTRSRFLVVSTNPLAVRATVALKGEFSFDVLSPNSRWLYVIQHVSSEDLSAYRVRAYDLQTRRLLAGAIVAKSESQTMRGYPFARATSSTGQWAYTLYHRDSGNPFVHALNAAQRFAVCIDLPATSADGLRLSKDGRQLAVQLKGATVAKIDTRSFKVT
jgi:hypothetical protein